MKIVRRTIAVMILVIMILLGCTVYAADVTNIIIRVYKDEKPVANAVVEFWLNNELKARAVTNINGSAAIVEPITIPSGDYIIYVYVNGSVYRFDKTIDENTTELNLTLSGVEAVKAVAKSWLNNYYVLGGIGAAFVFGLLIAYGLSGRRIPRRR